MENEQKIVISRLRGEPAAPLSPSRDPAGRSGIDFKEKLPPKASGFTILTNGAAKYILGAHKGREPLNPDRIRAHGLLTILD